MTERTDPIRAALARYAPIVDDPDAFLDACGRALPRVVWANPLRVDGATARAEMARLCPEAIEIPWHSAAWRLPPDVRPGKWDAYGLGWLHGQEEAALWTARALDAQPGERVLDLCASPGNKTAQLAVAMEDRGTLIANEPDRKRLIPLRANLERLGVTCAAVTRLDGGNFPAAPGSFDRVLADVPCTCEGTARKGTKHKFTGDSAHRMKIVQIQKAILRAATRLVRPGGEIVYATCTFAPEENEAVLDAIQATDIHIVPLDAPEGVRTSPGITSWDGHHFRSDVVHAARVWPHHNDTGGFFVARLRRVPTV